MKSLAVLSPLLLVSCMHTPVQTRQVTQTAIGVVYEQTPPDPTDPCPTTSVIIKNGLGQLTLFQSTTLLFDLKNRYVKISEVATHYDRGCSHYKLEVEDLR